MLTRAGEHSDTIYLQSTGSLFYQGDVYGRIRFDGNCNRQNLLVIQMIGRGGLRVKEKSERWKMSCNPLKVADLEVNRVLQKL
jgi:hypothetical protein